MSTNCSHVLPFPVRLSPSNICSTIMRAGGGTGSVASRAWCLSAVRCRQRGRRFPDSCAGGQDPCRKSNNLRATGVGIDVAARTNGDVETSVAIEEQSARAVAAGWHSAHDGLRCSKSLAPAAVGPTIYGRIARSVEISALHGDAVVQPGGGRHCDSFARVRKAIAVIIVEDSSHVSVPATCRQMSCLRSAQSMPLKAANLDTSSCMGFSSIYDRVGTCRATPSEGNMENR